MKSRCSAPKTGKARLPPRIPYWKLYDRISCVEDVYKRQMDTQFFMFFPGVGKGSGLVQTRALWENWAAELEGVRAWGRQSTFVIQPYLMQFGAARAVLDRLMRAVTGAPDLLSLIHI